MLKRALRSCQGEVVARGRLPQCLMTTPSRLVQRQSLQNRKRHDIFRFIRVGRSDQMEKNFSDGGTDGVTFNVRNGQVDEGGQEDYPP